VCGQNLNVLIDDIDEVGRGMIPSSCDFIVTLTHHSMPIVRWDNNGSKLLMIARLPVPRNAAPLGKGN
jgi:hypothetical protein